MSNIGNICKKCISLLLNFKMISFCNNFFMTGSSLVVPCVELVLIIASDYTYYTNH